MELEKRDLSGGANARTCGWTGRDDNHHVVRDVMDDGQASPSRIG